jgi:uncharacterized membrane protein
VTRTPLIGWLLIGNIALLSLLRLRELFADKDGAILVALVLATVVICALTCISIYRDRVQ